jgi:hypothetical protein
VRKGERKVVGGRWEVGNREEGKREVSIQKSVFRKRKT